MAWVSGKCDRTVRPLQKGFELSDLLHSPGFVSTPPRIVDRIASVRLIAAGEARTLTLSTGLHRPGADM